MDSIIYFFLCCSAPIVHILFISAVDIYVQLNCICTKYDPVYCVTLMITFIQYILLFIIWCIYLILFCYYPFMCYIPLITLAAVSTGFGVVSFGIRALVYKARRTRHVRTKRKNSSEIGLVIPMRMIRQRWDQQYPRMSNSLEIGLVMPQNELRVKSL